MKIDLKPRVTVKGYSQLFGISHTRIKARSKHINTSNIGGIFDRIRKDNGSFTTEYRLVKEPKGYIFRCALGDSGINGHHTTVKKAIITALYSVDIYIDEKFEYEHLPEFQQRKSIHLARKNCQHSAKIFNSRYKCEHCPTCDTTFYKEK